MKKLLKKMVTMGLTAAMAVSAMSIGAFADENDAVYTLIGEDGNEIVYTQSDLDAGHWDKEMLGDVAPIIYEDFPMSISGFANDFAELSMDIVYMKKLNDMDLVHLKITDMLNDSIIYDNDLVQQSFYSPILEEYGQYEINLTETVNGETKEYTRIVLTKRKEAEMPQYVTNPSEDDTSKVLVGDIDKLKEGTTVDENGKITIDSAVADYDKVLACNFQSYCNDLAENKLYRIYAKENESQYSGYLSTYDNKIEMYDLDIDVCSWEDLNAPSAQSKPSGVDIFDVMDRATSLTLTDSCFTLMEANENYKYAAYAVQVPVHALQGKTIRVTLVGSSTICGQIWKEIDGEVNGTTSKTIEAVGNTEAHYDLSIGSINNYMTLYVMVYFKQKVTGLGMIKFDVLNNGYDDDVTGSVFETYSRSLKTSIPNSEFAMTDAWDVDAFGMLPNKNNSVFKVTIKNRSLEDQNKLEQGEWVAGSRAKKITVWTVDDSDSVLSWWEDVVYTIPKNTDMSFYVQVSKKNDYVFTVYETGGQETVSKYQLEYGEV